MASKTSEASHPPPIVEADRTPVTWTTGLYPGTLPHDGGFSNFAISFSVISILTGAVTLFGYGFEMGGPLQMTLGWPLVSFFSMLVAMSMAELASAFPTSGAPCTIGQRLWAAEGGVECLHQPGGVDHCRCGDRLRLCPVPVNGVNRVGRSRR
jgi:hypothetical protein